MSNDFKDLKELAARYGATFTYATGGNFAAFYFERPNGQFLRVGLRASVFQPATPTEIELAKRLVLSVIDKPWSSKPESKNGVYLMPTWEYDDGRAVVRFATFGEEIADTYYNKARALIDTAPEASVPYSLFYLAVLARQGKLIGTL